MSQGDVSSFFGGQAFDPNSVKPAEDFDVLPQGKYPVLIEKAEFKPTKAGTGHYLELQMVVVNGPGKGRKLWNRLNVNNPDATCVEIALQTLSALCKATIGDEKFVNTNQLLQKACIASVTVDKSGYNAICTYSQFSTATHVQQALPASISQSSGVPIDVYDKLIDSVQAPPAQVPMQPHGAAAMQAIQPVQQQQQLAAQGPPVQQPAKPTALGPPVVGLGQAPPPQAQPQAPWMQPQQ